MVKGVFDALKSGQKPQNLQTNKNEESAGKAKEKDTKANKPSSETDDREVLQFVEKHNVDLDSFEPPTCTVKASTANYPVDFA